MIMQVFAQQLSPSDSLKIAAALLAACTVAWISTIGGMGVVVVILALWLSVHVYCTPAASIVISPLFLLAVNVFYPSAARWDATNTDPASEMRYWAAGLLVITLTALWRLRHSVLRFIPTSLRCFLLVAIAASFFGAIVGNALSYVARQLFGSLLLGVYFAFGQQFSDEDTFLCKMRDYAVPCVVAFLIYYAWIFPQEGIHKEITSLPTQSGILAILFAARGGWKWWSAAVLMMMPPILLVERRAIVGFILAMILLVAIRTTSQIKRISLELVAAGLILFSLVPTLGTMLVDRAMGTFMESILPPGARDASSLQDRTVQLVEAALIVKRSPIFGSGMGSELNWLSEARGDMQQAYVDNGWAYAAIKMGLPGLLSFVWLMWTVLRHGPGREVGVFTCILSMLLLVMFT